MFLRLDDGEDVSEIPFKDGVTALRAARAFLNANRNGTAVLLINEEDGTEIEIARDTTLDDLSGL